MVTIRLMSHFCLHKTLKTEIRHTAYSCSVMHSPVCAWQQHTAIHSFSETELNKFVILKHEWKPLTIKPLSYIFEHLEYFYQMTACQTFSVAVFHGFRKVAINDVPYSYLAAFKTMNQTPMSTTQNLLEWLKKAELELRLFILNTFVETRLFTSEEDIYKIQFLILVIFF